MLGLKIGITVFLGVFAFILLMGMFDGEASEETKRNMTHGFMITIAGIIVLYIL